MRKTPSAILGILPKLHIRLRRHSRDEDDHATNRPARTPATSRGRAATARNVLTARGIVTFDDAPAPPGVSAWVPCERPVIDLQVVAADPSWPEQYARLAELINAALGDSALSVEHVGSTAVRGLPAKPVIDIDLTVADSGDEQAYVPALEGCGFALVIREPWWYGHRCLRRQEPACNLHVFSPDCAEAERHRIFRDWLRSHPADRLLYARTKVAAAEDTKSRGGDSMDYNARKEPVLREIYDRAFHALGLLA